MGEVCVDFLESYSKFFDRFILSVDPNDQLPVKVAAYNLIESEIAGAVADWALQYLEQRKCPPSLTAHLVRRVVEEVRVQCKINPTNCGYRGDEGVFHSLKLMQVCISKLVEVCSRYKDNAELSSLPAPHPLPPVTTCAIKNSRRSMEDRHVVIHDFHSLFNIKGEASYYAVFDGHNGTDAAIYSVSHLHQYLAEDPYYPQDPMRALRNACIKTDDQFTDKAQRENLHGGTTAVFALLRPKERKLYVAWLGDSQAVLVRQGIPLQIVKPHKPDRSDERERIERLGGSVLYWGAWRVNGQLAVSRAIGDIEYKPYVTAMPDVEEITLNGTEDFLILACDGLWDFVTEPEATNAVYKQLQENPEDLEAVSHRLVALAKEQSSQDNISVVVVFLANPSEVAKRRLMETASPSPFVSQNGSDLFCGGPANGQHRAPFDDDEDFGPETDVDMVDDVLLSPAIAAAKALVQGKKDVEDDLERQRQQMSDFDDPADLDRSRDTPTPPAHEVGSNANADPLAESGGEESEEEWNYIPGKDPKPDSDTQEQDDMSSQLNPNAAEFVPVSPTRLLMQDDAIISASPRLGFEISLDNIQMPTELEFGSEIAQRPGDLEIANGSNHGDDYFMRDNFSTLRNKVKDFSVSSTCAELGDESVKSLNSSVNSGSAFGQEDIAFDKLSAVKNLEEKVLSSVIEKANTFETEATNILEKSDPMSTSVIGLKDLSSPEQEDIALPGTPKSTVVEAPASPINEDVSPLNQQTDLDSPTEDYIINTQKSPDLMSPGECPQDGLISGQERTSSSGFESESGAEEGEANVEENSVGFVTEHRKSPPIDLTFKPIQTFSDTNPFGALQTPTPTTPLDQSDVKTVQEDLGEPEILTPKKDVTQDKLDDFDFVKNTPSSFVSLRQPPHEELPVSFEDLESPKDVPQFVEPPNANSSFLLPELSKSPEPLKSFEDEFSPIKKEPVDPTFDAYLLDRESDKQNLPSDIENTEVEETSFTTDSSQVDKKESTTTLSHVDLDTTEGFLIEESKILQEEHNSEQSSNLNEQLNDTKSVSTSESCQEVEKALESSITPKILDNLIGDFDEKGLESDISPKTIDKVLSAFDDIKDDHETERKSESHEGISDSELETKEMKLEFESHIADSKMTPDELKNLDDSFEVISKEELLTEENTGHAQVLETLQFEVKESEPRVTPESGLKESEAGLPVEQPLDIKEDNVDLLSHFNQTNPFAFNDSLPTSVDKSSDNTLMSAFDNYASAVEEDLVKLEKSTLLSSVPDTSSQLEPQATKTVSYQTLTPADEPKITKSSSYVTGIEEETPAKSPVPEEKVPDVTKAEESPVLENEPLTDVVPTPVEITPPVTEEQVLTKVEPVQSQVVTETLITALEETSEVPSMAITEVPSTTETPPPTPAPGVDSKDDSQKANILVAAVAAAGAVAAGTAVVAAEKKSTAAAKKPLATATKKPSDTTAKAPGKPATTKTAPAAKPATKTTTSTKPSATTTKPAVTAAAAKPAAAKTAGATAAPKKPAAPSTKPSAPKPTTTAPKPAGAPLNQVPKQLSVSKTMTTTQKAPSKPTTPTSKPTTPTMPKSPGMGKADSVKSPPRLAAKTSVGSPRTTVGSPKPASAADKPADKKPLLNGDIKPLAKKAEAPIKKLATTATKAPTTTAKPPAKTTAATAKTAAAAPTKTATTKPASTTLTKPKPTSTTTAKPAATAAIKRPSSAMTKPTDKTGKETVNKQISSTKPAVNGKSAPAKPAVGVKKTDAKINGKTTEKNPIKKPEEIKKVEEPPSQIQEDNVTTTNGFAEHIIEEHQNTKIEEVAPVIIDSLN